MKKRKQHYVWEHYLRAWSIEGKIWCRRGEDCFHTSTENVAQSRDFYRLKEMSEFDLGVVRRLISKMDASAQESAAGWIPYFHAWHQLRAAMQGREISRELEEQLDVTINNLEEELHSEIEKAAVPILAELRDGDVTALKEREAFFHFSRFIGTQYMRTPSRARRNSTALRSLLPQFNAEAAWGLMRTIFAHNIAAALYVRRNSLGYAFLESPEGLFITGDQPMVNLKGPKGDGVPPTELELYYPLSPHLALVLDYDATEQRVERSTVAAHEAQTLNGHIVRAAAAQLYAHSKGALDAVQIQRGSAL